MTYRRGPDSWERKIVSGVRRQLRELSEQAPIGSSTLKADEQVITPNPGGTARQWHECGGWLAINGDRHSLAAPDPRK